MLQDFDSSTICMSDFDFYQSNVLTGQLNFFVLKYFFFFFFFFFFLSIGNIEQKSMHKKYIVLKYHFYKWKSAIPIALSVSLGIWR